MVYKDGSTEMPAVLPGVPSPRHQRSHSRFAILALTAGLSACALATDAPPTVEVLSVRLVGLGLTEQQLETTLCVTNPNANGIGF